jgi:hypothetical protein
MELLSLLILATKRKVGRRSEVGGGYHEMRLGTRLINNKYGGVQSESKRGSKRFSSG